ncbi:polysaccharide deacetylase family protein, partial [Patescibacteria group bacterium]|nr:polysaccharide deacetylase family protein [Patescibacteria group bacterium]MBU1728278.1 polysaccharide deacetylase family protein [Patescibacteria group bacterium]
FIIVIIVGLLALFLKQKIQPTKQINGMMLLIEFEEVDGLKNWANKFEEKKMPATIQVQDNLVKEHCDVIKDLSDRGFEIAGLYSPEAFWDKDYQFQYEKMKEVKENIEQCTDKKMKSFGSRYFAYDENTLKVADALGIDYVFARGTTGARATVYKPKEYNVKIIAVSNVPSKEMGTGSLCDYSLWARGENPDSFEKIATEALTSNDKIILVSHSYLGGMKLRWWNAYQNVFNKTNVNWLSLDEFATVDYELPNKDIPVNKEVKYETPKPEIPMEEEEECFPVEPPVCY